MSCPVNITPYSFKDVVVTWNGRRVNGFGSSADAAVSVQEGVDLAELKKGADGGAIFNLTSDDTAEVTIELLPNSPFIAVFDEAIRRMKMRDFRPNEITVTKASDGSGGGCVSAYITKKSPLSFGAKEQKELVYTIGCICWKPHQIQQRVYGQ